ncbi:MAG: hypothetical protein QNI84_14940 [Henriciella sp.]|nr:hypothetical protein [Henriciella sp.]
MAQNKAEEFTQTMPAIPEAALSGPLTEICEPHRECHHPLNRAEVSYPEAAIWDQLDANCDATFLIGPDGRAYDIEPNCTNDVFDESAIAGVRTLEFNVVDQCGEPCAYGDERYTYPLEYRHAR